MTDRATSIRPDGGAPDPVATGPAPERKFSLARIDRFQRTHGWLGFPLAVRQKYSDDQGGYLAAATTYYGFFALFPLLLVFVSVLGFALHGHPAFEHSVVNSALAQLPVVGGEIQKQSLHGSALALGLGLAASIWAGMSVFTAFQNAIDQLWGIPYVDRPGFVPTRLRSLGLMVVLGAAMIAGAALGELATVGTGFGLAIKIATILLSVLVDCGLFWVALYVLASGRVSWRSLRGGAIGAGISYECLQLIGGVYIHHVLEKSTQAYGTFALVVGLLTWIYLTIHITLLAAEGNVVATKHLWPRSLASSQPATPADEAAWQLRVGVEKRRAAETIEVTVER